MNRWNSLLTLAVLFAGQHLLAQNVYVNLVPTRPGDHDVASGSIVHVSNTTDSDVTVQVPYEPPLTVPPGGSTTITVRWSPGGSTYVEGSGGTWRFNPTISSTEPQPR